MTEETPKSKKVNTRKPAPRKQKQPVEETSTDRKGTWVHLDDYLVTLDCRDEVKEGFRIYMRRSAYQRSYAAFDEEFERFMNRKI